jgi:hypothetical protein
MFQQLAGAEMCDVLSKIAMASDLGVWLAGLILLLPIAVFGLAWTRIISLYQSREVQSRQRLSYLIALGSASLSTLAYVGYWTWRVFQMYRTSIPLEALLSLERLMHASRVISIAAIGCLLIGRGPYRTPVLLYAMGNVSALDTWRHRPLGLRNRSRRRAILPSE